MRCSDTSAYETSFRKIRMLACVLITGVACGCTRYYRIDPLLNTLALPDSTGHSSSIYDRKRHQINTDSGAFMAAWAAAHESPQKRNALVATIIVTSDEICLTHKAQIQATSNSLNLSFGALTTLFSGAASVLKSATSASALSAAAAASNSARSLVNAEVYQQSFSVTILNAIDSNRDSQRAMLRSGFERSLSAYPIELALSDLSQYHESCSFVSGLAFVSKAVQQRQQSRSTLLDRIATLRDQMKSNSANTTGDSGQDAQYTSNNIELMKQISNRQTLLTTAPE